MALYDTTTKAEFEEKVLNSEKLVLVDFWAQWCPPCRAMAPVLQDVSKSMDKDVDVVKVDIEASPDNNALAAKYEVRSIPNMNLFKNGQLVDTFVGMLPKLALEDALKKQL